MKLQQGWARIEKRRQEVTERTPLLSGIDNHTQTHYLLKGEITCTFEHCHNDPLITSQCADIGPDLSLYSLKAVRSFTTRSREISKPRDKELSYRSENWQVSRLLLRCLSNSRAIRQFQDTMLPLRDYMHGGATEEGNFSTGGGGGGGGNGLRKHTLF